MAWVAIAGAVISAASAIKQGQDAKAAADYNAQVERNKATMSRDQASMQIDMQRRRAALQVGDMRAGYGASGISGNEGSPLDVLAASVTQAELDSQTIRYRGEVNATGYDANSTLDTMSGKAAQQQSYLKAGAAALNSYAGGGKPGTAISTTNTANVDYYGGGSYRISE